MRDDLTRLQQIEAVPDISILQKFDTASQTDLSGEIAPIGARLAEMAKVRLQYDESRKKVHEIQQQLADLEDRVNPGQTESDKDRYSEILICFSIFPLEKINSFYMLFFFLVAYCLYKKKNNYCVNCVVLILKEEVNLK